MPCAATHRLVNFTATTVLLSALEHHNEKHHLVHPVIGGILSATAATLPDKIEPAIHPHHRQFFHSIAFAMLVGYGVYKVYKWEPKTAFEELLRIIAAICGSAYLLHLAADSLTARSLPLVGK